MIDMLEENKSKTTDCVLKLLGCALRGMKCTLPEDTDWDDLIIECKNHAVQALAFYALNSKCVPHKIYDKWKMIAVHTIAQNTYCKVAHQKLSKLLIDNDIQFITFKGVSSSLYYMQPEVRALGDVDFYVPENDFNKCDEVLRLNGFTFNSKDRDHDWSYCKGNIHYELHHSFPGIPEGNEGNIIRMQLCSLISDSKIEQNVIIPSDYHHGLILLLHTASHLLNEGIGLRHLCDWATFVNHFENDEFCLLFKKSLETVGLWKFAQILTAASIKYLGIDEKEWVKMEAFDGIVDELVKKDIIAKGNFGSKIERDLSGLMVSNGFSGKISETSNTVQLFQNLARVTKQHWQISRKIKLLIPIGSIWFGMRYFVRMIFGKREKLNIFAMSKEANKRKDLYKHFELFKNTTI